MPKIKLQVRENIAKNLTPEVVIVCGNEEDYEVEFDFDEKWSKYNVKTGLFIRNGELIARPFDGNICPIPVIENATLLGIGVKTNDGRLHTTTPAFANCLKSASDLATNKIPAPKEDVYDEILALINKYVEDATVYSGSAIYAEEAEIARNYTRGGGIDKQFKDIIAGNGMSIGLSMDSNYKLTIDLKNKKGAVISSGMIDLPIESLITNASYGNKILTLTFQSGQMLMVSIADIVSGLVPETRKVNGKALSSDITLFAEDVGAYPKSDTYQKTEVGNLLSATKTELRQDIEGKQVVGYAYFSTETEKASGYIKGGQIDKEFTAIKKALASLNVSET